MFSWGTVLQDTLQGTTFLCFQSAPHLHNGPAMTKIPQENAIAEHHFVGNPDDIVLVCIIQQQVVLDGTVLFMYLYNTKQEMIQLVPKRQ